ncbi:protein SHQ1 homolog [Argiope bruennichi]|uniref:Protein SHQ1 homolog n=1 Tax=Argiope bruennichi TaxID=94029 RepID=A0A8T0EFX1_ARGBR|nr:protein SHQ1 homolog [Argiope bruennichi]KAF8770298.1 Protein SHQ1 like protein [Argiope bruennichi]
MLTPAFDLTQDDKFLIISIQVPYAKFSEYEVHFEDDEFMFFCKPYYLKLNLPGKVVYIDQPKCEYDFEKRIFKVYAPKAQRGEVFEGLDLVNILLKPKKCKVVGTPKIEVLESTNDVDENDEEFDWSIEQVPSEDEFGSLNITGQQCGFANNYSFSVFNLKEEAQEIFDVSEPQSKTPKTRSIERIQIENKKFDEEHYLADLYNDEEIQQLILYNPEWVTLYDEIENKPPDDIIKFTSEEKERLRKLPCKEYLLDKNQKKTAYLSLIDILFAYAYNKRTTEGENTVESAWTINKISATLSWLETYSSIQQVAITSIRRSLIYPLYRHFELSVTILEDVRKIMMLGIKYIMKCLLEIHEMFNLSEPRYILNDLFIVDYIVWIQRCPATKLVSLAAALEKVLLTKGDIGLNLVDIETLAKVAWMSRESFLLDSSATKESKTNMEDKQPDHSQTSTDKTLSSQIEKLSLDAHSRASEESNSEYEECSSCTSGSSGTSSSTYETDSSVDSDDDSDSASDESDDDSETSDSDNNSYCRLLRGASIQEWYM